MPNRIPLYDETAPVACTIGDDEVPERLALMESMRTALSAYEETEHGIVLVFPATPENERRARTFAVDEKRCCQFWGFEVERAGDTVRLHWHAPPDARPVLDRLAAVFRGSEPVESLRDLL